MEERQVRLYRNSETTFAERRNHLQSVPRVGFDVTWADWGQKFHRDEEWVVNTIAAVGLPVEDIGSLHRRDNTHEKPNTLGSWWRSKREFSLYKLLGDIPPIAQMGTIAHELAHVDSPFDQDNTILYGSREAQFDAMNHSIDVAQQTLDTKVFLNGYHKKLYQNMQNGVISPEMFAEETHAIMVELRFSNPKHLMQVQDAQKEMLRRLDREDEFVTIFSAEGDEAVGVDRTLLSLMPQFHGDICELRNHIHELHENMLHDEKNNANVLAFPQQSRISRAA